MESFESGFGDWENMNVDDIDWTRHSGSTPSSSTGPSFACDGTYYLYTESSSSGYPNKQAILQAPCFDLSPLESPQLTFEYHMYGATMGTLSVEISNNDCTSWTPIWNISGNQGNSWNTAVLDLSPYAGTIIKVRFKGITGSSYTSDIAIDNVTVSTNIYDLDHDGSIGVGDLMIFSENWLQLGPGLRCDFHKDGNNVINLLDFAVFSQNW